MSVTFAQPSPSSSNMFSHIRTGSDSLASSAPTWDEMQPIPWEQQGKKQLPLASNTPHHHNHHNSAYASSSNESRPPQIMVWRTTAATHNANDAGVSSAPLLRSAAGVSTLGCNTAASRSRVSMDALPVEGDGSPHPTISPSSSSASLPMMDEMTSPPPPRATAIQPAPFARPVGLGLSAVRDPHGNEWPGSIHGIADEADSDDDEMTDLHEMDHYMASHRAPVDATLRSMPGVVGLGDGWAGGPQTKPKKKGWFRRNKKEEVEPVEADPLALWAMPETPTAPNGTPTAPSAASPAVASTGMGNCNSPEIETSAQQHHAQIGDSKWWTSTRNLFSASQRVWSSPQPQHPPSAFNLSRSPPPSFPTSLPSPTGSKSSARGLRSKLGNFGSMVDLRRVSERQSANLSFPPLDEPTSASSTSSGPRAPEPSNVSKRHSVAAFLRNTPVHPLELSHSNGSTTASRSQPYSLSASSSQPSLISPTSHHHPMLRQAFARSESYLAGAGASQESPPRPAPLIINSGAFVNTGPLPTWRPPVMSPTPLLEVREEDEDEQEAADGNGGLNLQRSATFGDEEEYAAQKVSAAPGLSDIMGSPLEESRALSVSTTFSSKNGDLAPPPQKFLHRLRSVLSLGRGRKASMVAHKSPKLPESPRSFASEQVMPVFPAHPELDTAHMSSSVGRNTRRRSRLFSRRRESIIEPMHMNPRPTIIQNGRPTILSPAASNSPSPMLNRSPAISRPSPKFTSDTVDNAKVFPDRASVHAGVGIGSSLGVGLGVGSLRNRRTSWAAPLPPIDNTDDEDDDDERTPSRRVEKRLSRVSLRRLTGQSKPRPPLGTVFPRPPTEMQSPPSLHWAFPASYSTPMLHKFGGSTLSLALDISAEGKAPTPGLDDIQESSPVSRRNSYRPAAERRERAISATIAALTARQTTASPSPSPSNESSSLHRNTSTSARARRTVPINIENLNSSNDSLTLPTCNVVDFPLPPSSSSGDFSSPDPDHVEQLYTPRDVPQYPTLPSGYYRRRSRLPANDSVDSGEESSAGSSSSQSKQPSWSTCKTSGETVASGRATPLATPTLTTPEGDDTRCSSYGSLITAMEGSEPSEVEITPRAQTYTAKRMSVVTPANQQIVA